MADSRKLPLDLQALRKQLLEVLESSPESKARFFQKTLTDSPNIQSEIESLRKEVREILSSIAESRAGFLRVVAGEHLGILNAPDDVKGYLYDQDPKVRQAALIVSSERWPLNSKVADACEQLALGDPDSEVRAVAATSLGACFANTFNSTVSRLLAGILLEKHNRKDLRLSAYVGLLEVQGKSLREYTPSLRDIRDFKFPEGVDWNFVERFA